MSLTAKDVAQITRLLEESNFDELYLEIDGLKLSLRRGSAPNRECVADPASALVSGTTPPTAIALPPERPASPMSIAAVPQQATDPCALPGAGGALPGAGALTDANTLPVSAPLLGTFYRAPKPGAAPFVEIGSQVAEDTIVGIIEVMKLMNTVRAGVRGKVSQILARDGALVEYGETLLRVSKAS